MYLNDTKSINDGAAEANEWRISHIKNFWNEIAYPGHLVQFYENDRVFLDTLEGFAGTGFLEGDSVVIIASSKHLTALQERLKRNNFNLDSLISGNKYFPMEVNGALSKVMKNNQPDEDLIAGFTSGLAMLASAGSGKIRVFGEMSPVLWEQGLKEAAIQMEHIWHQYHNKDPFLIYCAYPKFFFTLETGHFMDICKSHSKIIDGRPRPSTEILYKTVKQA